jgi:PKD repeat protein
VAPANQPPVAVFGSSCTNLGCTFDSTGTNDPDGSIATYTWTFGDGGTSTLASPPHTYAAGGTYTVTLTVTDNQGATGSVQHSVTVAPANQPPVAVFSSTCTNLGCTFDSTGTNDPDGSIATYAWTFGDGGTSTLASPPHTYAAGGTYTVTLTVTDNKGATGSVQHSVTVAAATLYATDSFSRSASGGWGNADSGGAWTTSSGSSCAVSGGVGTITMANPGQGPSIYLNGVQATDTDLQVTATTDKPGSGSGIYLSAIGRRVAGQGDYRVKIRLLSTGQVGLTLLRTNSAGAETVIKAETIVTGLTYTAGTQLRVRLQVTGTGTTTLRAKVWLAGGTEPGTWTSSGTDTTAGLQAAGGVGLMAYLATGATNAPVVASFDNLQAGPTA